MEDPLPRDRMPVRFRGLFQVLIGGLAIGVGLAILTQTGVHLEKGWVGAVPEPLYPVLGGLLVLFGLLLLIPGLLWMLVPLSGIRPPVVHFESTHVEIRGSLVPTTFVVNRSSVLEVHQWTFGSQVGRGLGMWPMVVVRTGDGRGRGVQYLYEGDPDELAADLARWASVPLGPTRRGVTGAASTGPASSCESSGPSDHHAETGDGRFD